MSDFKVSISNGQVYVLCGDQVPETDIIDLLEFDENMLEDLYFNHAAIQARWEQIAINLKNSWDSFDDEFVKKWWAHNKRFAKLSLLGQGEKSPTVDAIKDTAILITSEDTDQHERDKYAYWAHKATQDKKVDRDLQLNLEDFTKRMYKYLNMEPAWYFEVITRAVKNLEKNYLTVQNICKRLESRSFHMKELKDLSMVRHGNAGPMTHRQKVDEERLTQAIRDGQLHP
jgi:hypothetical protein